MVCVLNQPHLSIAFARVELCRCAIDIEENSLGNIFRLTVIANNLSRNAQD
jgi:hypothetical protein